MTVTITETPVQGATRTNHPIRYPFIWEGFSGRVYLRIKVPSYYDSGDVPNVPARDVDVLLRSIKNGGNVGDVIHTGTSPDEAWSKRSPNCEGFTITNLNPVGG